MAIDRERSRQCLKAFDFRKLFIEELGWDKFSTKLVKQVDGNEYSFHAVAEKRGVVVLVSDSIPDYAIRVKLDKLIAKDHFEHLIVFSDKGHGRQLWQWVRKEPGKPTAVRPYPYATSGHGAERLLQKLDNLAFTMQEEEEGIHTGTVTGRLRTFDVEKVTKKFYERFKTEHSNFLSFIKGIPDKQMESWYASVMINRLMFLYFIQEKGFLNGDKDYLRNRLTESRDKEPNAYHSKFLSPLFFQGFARKKTDRSAATNKLLGDIPYLNGGLFQKHQIEELHGKTIVISDKAFEKLFDFFKEYNWHLDEREDRSDREINPDVLGYIFEKYINQKQMGAYYTKEDITEYIAQNTIIPFLLDEARKGCAVAFAPEGSVWHLLRDDPDRYIHDAMKKGASLPLPPDIKAGVDDVEQRRGWNRTAPEEFALPTEIWRETIDRHQRYRAIRAKLAAGEVHQVNDLVTLNLNIRQFAQDVIQFSEGPELLRAIWKAIEKVSVLDPTCGSGAFLFAALNILKPLYEACLQRMNGFLEDLEGAGRHHPKKFEDFKSTLQESERHPKQDYFILKAIIVNNLFGVDIMEEAVEICKLRLFLKLVAQVDSQDRIEPLPDIDFNIRAGNTLIGYARYEDVEKAVGSKLDFGDAMSRIQDKVLMLDSAVEVFRKQQTQLDGTVTPEDKAELRRRFSEFEAELNDYLSGEYGIKRSGIEHWKKSHQPLHWFCDFHSIITSGGFEVIIGNPPYVETKDITDYKLLDFATSDCGDLYANTLERAVRLVRSGGQLGFIIPLSAFTVDGFSSLQDVYFKNTDILAISNWSGDAHPSKLFEGVDKRLHIVLARAQTTTPVTHQQLSVSKYIKWYAAERPLLFKVQPRYAEIARTSSVFNASLPKISSSIESAILRKLKSVNRTVGHLASEETGHQMFYTRKASFFMQFLDFVPEVRDARGALREPSELKTLNFASRELRDLALACLSTSLFYFFYTVNSDCRNLNKREIVSFPIPLVEAAVIRSELSPLVKELMASYRRHSSLRTVHYREKGNITVQYFNFRPAKPIIDKIDLLLAPYYTLEQSETDFIINYGIKYRMGADANGG